MTLTVADVEAIKTATDRFAQPVIIELCDLALRALTVPADVEGLVKKLINWSEYTGSPLGKQAADTIQALAGRVKELEEKYEGDKPPPLFLVGL